MISYAQNFEDVMLRRVFRNKANGFYIDVGAMDPVLHSVTKFFYDQGWCGINIEPNEWFFEKLAAERERDINLNVALGDRDGARTFYVFKEHGISTFDEQSRDRFVDLGFDVEQKTVNITTLAKVCHDHAHDRPIDFLKVDCEGWEKLALAGADWSRFRPTIVVVEATLPLTNIASYEEWEPVLTESAQYEFVYFDGLNRFYLRRDSPGLRTHFSTPPNVFDEFKVSATEMAEQASQAMTRERDSLAAGAAELERKLEVALAENQWLRESEQAVRAESVARTARIVELERESSELAQALLKTRLWVGRLSQDLVASKQRLGR